MLEEKIKTSFDENFKIALCFAGLPSIYSCTVTSLLKGMKLEAKNIDLICCFWRSDDLDSCKIDDLSKNFKTSHIKYVKPELLTYECNPNIYQFPETKIERVMSMYFIRQQLLFFIESLNQPYDVFIFARPDIFFSGNINLNRIVNGLRKGKSIYFPTAGNYRNGITDNLAIGDVTGIQRYLSVFSSLQNILSYQDRYIPPCKILQYPREFISLLKILLKGITGKPIRTIPFHPEILNRINIESSNLAFDFFDCGSLIIKRENSFSILITLDNTPSFTLASELRPVSGERGGHSQIFDPNGK